MISKSKYLRGLNCQKSLWLYKNKYKLQKKATQTMQARFDAGNDVGELATKLYPDGIEVEYEPKNDFSEMLDKTKELIEYGEKTIYEATFNAKGAVAMIDILHKTTEGWNIYEVKSSTKVIDEYYDDAAIQWFILNEQAGLKLNKVFIVHINNQYVRNGDLDIEELFMEVDVTEDIIAKQDEVAVNLGMFISIESIDNEPCIEIGPHCSSPHECSFKETYCWSHIPKPSIFDVGSILAKKKFELYQEGIIEISDIPTGMKLNEKQDKIVLSYIKNEAIIDKEAIKEFINEIQYPISFFDFESFTEVIPHFDDQGPYKQITFQYSLHILPEPEGMVSLEHKEFLGDENTDPREVLVNQMLKDLPEKGSIIAAKMSFEQSMIRELAVLFPQYEKKLLACIERFIDIQVPFKNLYYCHPKLLGKYSMKLVLPALFPGDPELDYKQLEIQGGGDAMLEFPNLRNISDSTEREKIRNNLLKYCGLDTFGMVKIFEMLRRYTI